MTWKRAYRKAKIEHSIRAEKITDIVPADIFLPCELLPFALKLKAESEWRDLIAYLINRHRARALSIADGAENIRFRYQKEGLNLQRFCYVPYRDVLCQLRMLSYASRISMCALVVLMLEWEKQNEVHAELDSFAGVPIEFESGWRKIGAVLIISAGVQMSCAPHPPP